MPGNPLSSLMDKILARSCTEGIRQRYLLENKGFEEREANDGMPVTMTAIGADGHGRGTAGCVAAERETAGCGNQRGAVNQRCVTVGSRLWKASMGVDG